MTNKKNFIIRDSVYGDIEIKDKVAVDIINTKEFQRLRRISQISGGQFVFPSANHTRFMHSIGVYHLISRILDKEGFNHYSEKQKKIVKLAGLLHDIGHGPYSHSFEVVTELVRDIKDKELIEDNMHEDYSIQIIKDPNTEINKVLLSADITSDEIENICNLIIGKHDDKILLSLVSSQLDADRMDYLLRDGFTSGVSYSHLDCDWIIRQMRIDQEGQKIIFPYKTVYAIESYLIGRYHMYKQIYLHPISVGFDSTLKSFMQRLYDLIKSGFNFKSEDIIEHIGSLIEFNKISATEYCKLDDFTFFYYVKKLGEEDDFALSKLSDMLVNRKFLRKIVRGIMDHSELEKRLDLYLEQNLEENNLKDKETYYNYFMVKYTSKPVHIYETDKEEKIPIYIDTIDGVKTLDQVSSLFKSILNGNNNTKSDESNKINKEVEIEYYTLKELMKHNK